MSNNFWVLLIGTFCGGLYAAAHQSYRFAAADTASDAYRPKVVSWVLAGGGCAAVLGPQARFIVAVACGIASYGMMNMVMTSAPLAMVDCGHSVTNATLGIQWHVLAMYAP